MNAVMMYSIVAELKYATDASWVANPPVAVIAME